LTGIHIVDGLLASGTAELAMVVTSDMDPEPGVSRGLDSPAVGGSVLLSADDSRAGFMGFQFATVPEFADLFYSYVDWKDDARRGLHHGRNLLTVEIAEPYGDRALECADSTARDFLDAQALDPGEVDLLIATASVPGFSKGWRAGSESRSSAPYRR
jgi:3-oxoacyl-[acyl-carrier-protein] synthase III